jgi:DNA-binding response OmpR family regulator
MVSFLASASTYTASPPSEQFGGHLRPANLALPLPNVLLVDDSIDDLRPLVDILIQANLRLLVAFDGQDGVTKATLHHPDLILMDVSMPRMDGFAACRQLKAQPVTAHIPIIFLTAADDLTSRLQGLTLGGVDYVSKPFNAQEVLARVRIHLDLSRRKHALPVQEEPGSSAAAGGVSAEEAGGVGSNAGPSGVLVRAATAYLRQHLASPPATDVLAHLVGTNERKLGQAFHDCFGMPVFDWLREERMRQACHLLANTDTAVSSIGDYLGFSTPANFAKAFRLRFGMSPRALRLERQQQRHRELAAQCVAPPGSQHMVGGGD